MAVPTFSIMVSFFMVSLCLSMFGFVKTSQAQKVPAIFVFGDSLVDVGNNNFLPVSVAKADYPHNGVDFPNKKATGRFSNGKNFADFFAQKVGLPTPPPYLSIVRNKTATMDDGVRFVSGGASILDKTNQLINGVSFASGGASILNRTKQLPGQSIHLTKQGVNFGIVHEALVQSKGLSSVRSGLSKSVFLIVVGNNDLFDYADSTTLRNKYNPQQYVDLMASQLKLFLQKLYQVGARKYVVAGIPPVGCTPSQRIKTKSEECNESINSVTKAYNEVLKSTLQKLKLELKGLSYSYLDNYAMFQAITQNPASYGFKEVKAACCGVGKLKADIPCLPIATYCSNRTEHTFWDLYGHPTEATASILADNFFNGPPHYAFPMNIRQLLVV